MMHYSMTSTYSVVFQIEVSVDQLLLVILAIARNQLPVAKGELME